MSTTDETRFCQFVDDFERISASKDTLRASFSFFERNWVFIHSLSDMRMEKNSPSDSVVTLHMWAAAYQLYDKFCKILKHDTKLFDCWTL